MNDSRILFGFDFQHKLFLNSVCSYNITNPIALSFITYVSGHRHSETRYRILPPKRYREFLLIGEGRGSGVGMGVGAPVGRQQIRSRGSGSLCVCVCVSLSLST